MNPYYLLFYGPALGLMLGIAYLVVWGLTAPIKAASSIIVNREL